MSKRPTIHTVAEAAGVGVGTVSRVLNNHPSVRDTTRERVLSTIEELGYRPNSSVPRRTTTEQAFLALPDFSAALHQQILRCTEQALADSGLSLCALSLAPEATAETLLDGGHPLQTGTGLFIAHDGLHDLWTQHPRDLPAVRVGGYSAAIDCAYIDDRHGGVLAGEYAATLPGQVVSLWPEPADRTDPQHQMLEGLQAGLGGAGLSAEYTLTQQRSRPAQVAHVLDRLAGQSQPTTLVTYSDCVAAEVLEQAHKRGLDVGEQLRIIGYGDFDIAAPLGLTTVHAPVAQLAEAAVQLLQSGLSHSSKRGKTNSKPHKSSHSSAPKGTSKLGTGKLGTGKPDTGKPERKCVVLEPRLALRGTA